MKAGTEGGQRAQAAREVPQATWTGFYHAKGLPGDPRFAVRTDRQIVRGVDRSHASSSDSVLGRQARLGDFSRALTEGSIQRPPALSRPLAAVGDPRARLSPLTLPRRERRRPTRQ